MDKVNISVCLLKENKMTIQEKIKLLNVIKNWCFQYYDERSGVSTELCGIQIFKLLPKYQKVFPENCFYTGMVYRKAEKGYNCPIHLVACSKEKGLIVG